MGEEADVWRPGRRAGERRERAQQLVGRLDRLRPKSHLEGAEDAHGQHRVEKLGVLRQPGEVGGAQVVGPGGLDIVACEQDQRLDLPAAGLLVVLADPVVVEERIDVTKRAVPFAGPVQIGRQLPEHPADVHRGAESLPLEHETCFVQLPGPLEVPERGADGCKILLGAHHLPRIDPLGDPDRSLEIADAARVAADRTGDADIVQRVGLELLQAEPLRERQCLASDPDRVLVLFRDHVEARALGEHDRLRGRIRPATDESRRPLQMLARAITLTRTPHVPGEQRFGLRGAIRLTR